MGSISSAFCTSAKSEFFSGAHCFQAITTASADTSNTAFTLTSLAATTGIAVGMAVSGTGIPANTVVASINSGTQVTMSKAATASNSGTTITFTGDQFYCMLFKNSVTGTYAASTTNYSQVTGNSDEVSGVAPGYTTGGALLTVTSPTTSSTTAYVTFANPSWTSATFSTDGCLIYNNSARLGAAASSGSGRSIGVFSFSGTQSVAAGVFSVIMPAASSSTAIFRIA